ncbi:MAG: ABC transporter ATP-binding protein [Hydrogenophaga sp.]|uniref:ABC transporter ATP-binding protein n=1 Tax=Hydrogenophaga sp. TaxID=1904254 RepID=UPI003D9BAE90
MCLRLGTVLLAAVLATPSWAADWSVCPGWDQATATADSSGYWAFASPYTYHWSDENAKDHRAVFALSVSRQLPNQRFCGASLFRNSFGQPSAYAFTGWLWPNPIKAYPEVYATVSAGIIYGYVGEFKDKVPLNVGGFSPVVIPTVGYRLTPQLAVEVQILGTAAVMFGTSWRF